jgi:flagellar hook-associated protein 2
VGSTAISRFSGAPTLTQPSTDVNSPGFTGLSSYSSDLQNAMNRSLAFATLPLRQLQNEQSLLTSQSMALSSLDGQFSALQSAVTSLNSASQNLLYSSISDQTVLSASLGADALPGTYTIHVTDAGSASIAFSSSATPVTDPTTQNISSASSFTLTVNGVVQPTITPAANNLNALAAAINAANAGVQATIVNVGQPSAPNYQLSLQSTELDNIPIQLNDGSANLMTPLVTGSPAQYQVNGAPATPISSTTDTVTIAPGVTVTLLQTGTSAITVSQSASAISNALSSFARAYNSAVDELAKSRGQNGGALSGQSVITGLTQSLRELANYSDAGGSSFTSLTDLGLGFDTDGHLNFDPTALSTVRGSQLNDLVSFLGSSSTSGFLQFAANLMTGIEDPTSGLLKTAISSTSNEIANENQLIADRQDQITRLQTTLQAKMSAADAIISRIESQVTYFTTLFQSMLFPPNQQR